MNFYHITGSQKFYGQKDAITYYSVPANKVEAGCIYLCNTHNLSHIFIYLKQKNKPIGKNQFIATYTAKYKNFRTTDNKLHLSFNF